MILVKIKSKSKSVSNDSDKYITGNLDNCQIILLER